MAAGSLSGVEVTGKFPPERLDIDQIPGMVGMYVHRDKRRKRAAKAYLARAEEYLVNKRLELSLLQSESKLFGGRLKSQNFSNPYWERLDHVKHRIKQARAVVAWLKQDIQYSAKIPRS